MATVRGSESARDQLADDLVNRTIDKPVFVVDAGSFPGWFGVELGATFPRYNSSFGAYVTGASHETLVYSTEYSTKTAELIRYFVQYVTGKITFAKFDQQRGSISGMAGSPDSWENYITKPQQIAFETLPLYNDTIANYLNSFLEMKYVYFCARHHATSYLERAVLQAPIYYWYSDNLLYITKLPPFVWYKITIVTSLDKVCLSC